jgi:hypothetical protein
VLVAADLGYTFVATINDELLINIEWFWSFVYSIGYLLLTMSILWFSKIKEILEYKKISEVLKSEQASEIDIDNEANESVEFIENSNQILGIMTTVSDKAERYIDILFAQHVIQDSDIIKFIGILEERTRKNKRLNIRILLPYEFAQYELSSNNSNLSIQYFERHLDANTITSILDSEFMYIFGSISEDTDSDFRYFVQHVRNEPRLLASIALFERIWLLKKSVDF